MTDRNKYSQEYKKNYYERLELYSEITKYRASLSNIQYEGDLDESVTAANLASRGINPSILGIDISSLGGNISSSSSIDFEEAVDYTLRTNNSNINIDTKGRFTLPSNVKPAKISGGVVYPPSGSKNQYSAARIAHARQTNFAGFVSVDTDRFYFINGEENNMFAPDFASILMLISEAHRQSTGDTSPIQINSGFRAHPVDYKYSSHMWGGAVDIGTKGYQDALRWADMCYGLGLRAIAIGGRVYEGAGFVHVDCGVPYQWSYSGVPKYTGPSR